MKNLQTELLNVQELETNEIKKLNGGTVETVLIDPAKLTQRWLELFTSLNPSDPRFNIPNNLSDNFNHTSCIR